MNDKRILLVGQADMGLAIASALAASGHAYEVVDLDAPLRHGDAGRFDGMRIRANAHFNVMPRERQKAQYPKPPKKLGLGRR